MEEARINLGCGGDYRQGYLNVDIRPDVKPDMVLDLETTFLRCFRDNTFDEILAKDVIEHISWRLVGDFLRDCFRVLKPGGKMYIQVPDLEAIAKKVILDPNFKFGELEGWRAISYWVYGGQEYKENTHKAGFTIPTLKRLLEEIGFVVDKIENDGGTNIVCHAHKPET